MLISGLVVILKPFVSVSVIPIHPDFAGFSNTSCGGGAFVGGTLGFPWFEKLKRNRILDSLWCVVLGYDHRMNLSICIHTPEKVVWYVWYVYMCIHIYIYMYVYMYICTYIHVAYAPHWLVIASFGFIIWAIVKFLEEPLVLLEVLVDRSCLFNSLLRKMAHL